MMFIIKPLKGKFYSSTNVKQYSHPSSVCFHLSIPKMQSRVIPISVGHTVIGVNNSECHRETHWSSSHQKVNFYQSNEDLEHFSLFKVSHKSIIIRFIKGIDRVSVERRK